MTAPTSAFLWVVGGWIALASAQGASLPGYARDLPPESDRARALRHARVAERRAGTVLIAHRGASTLATENTLEAYAAAMDYGADGCEVDVRRTADGVLVLFHDDMLDRLTDGFGKAEDLSYAELLALHPQIARGTATQRTRPPTFAALLILARQRAILLHLDVKEPGLDDDIARALDEADMWDHVVAINTGTVPILLKHPKLKLLRYKGGVYENRLDMDPSAVKAALAKPGQLLILEDPRLAARELNRPPYRPLQLPHEVFARWKPAPPGASHPAEFVPVRYLDGLAHRVKADSVEDLLALLHPDDPLGRASAQRILERAWASERLGQLGRGNSRIVERLEFQVQHPGLHEDWLYNALDGHAAARALGRLRATGSAPARRSRISPFPKSATDEQPAGVGGLAQDVDPDHAGRTALRDRKNFSARVCQPE